MHKIRKLPFSPKYCPTILDGSSSRRGFLKSSSKLCLGALVVLGPSSIPAGKYSASMGAALAADTAGSALLSGKPHNPDRSINLVNIHTGEKLAAIYWSAGKYDTVAMQKINQLLRDHRTNQVIEMDLQVIDFLATVQGSLNTGEPLQILSGYRSPQTNAKLAKKSNGVAKNSLHMSGRAIDFRQPGTKASVLRDLALDTHLGGVGYYRKSDFIHIDTGRYRQWG